MSERPKQSLSTMRAFGTLALVGVVASVTACVFDSGGNYNGGGRNSPVKKDENSSEPAPTTTTPTPTTTTTNTTPTPDAAVPDTGGGG